MVKSLVVHTDGSARPNPGPASIGVVVKDSSGKIIKKISQRIGEATNNQAEYTALITGLKEAKKLGASHVNFKLDSELLVKQIKGQYRVKNAGLKPLFRQVQQLITKFDSFHIEHVPRDMNKEADACASSVWE